MDDSLAEDEAKLARYANQLVERVERVLPGWVERAVVSRTDPGRFETDSLLFVPTHQAQVDALRAVMPKLRVLMRLDIDRQRSTPLEVIRKAIPFPTRVLQLAGVEPVERDDFHRQQFPGDDYALAPMSLADVDEQLQTPGIEWGAAKAHVHLRRRREAGDSAAAQVAAYVTNLMDRGKIVAAMPMPTWLNSGVELAASDADLVLIDLTRVKDLSALGSIGGWTVGYGPHVETQLLADAEAGGCDVVLPRSVFFRRLGAGQIKVGPV